MKNYIIKKVQESELQSRSLWERVPKLQIDCFPWDDTGYKPEVEAALVYTDSCIRTRFVCHESSVKAVYLNQNDPVYKDSCVEFFYMLTSDKDKNYMNIEINAIGTMLIGFGKDRNNRTLLEVDQKTFNISSSLNNENISLYKDELWWIEFSLPFSFINRYFGEQEFKPGKLIKANLYKCGDDTDEPHFGCWNPITTHSPDFHRPEFFGDLILG